MKFKKIMLTLLIFSLFSVAIFDATFTNAGWETDPTGDASKAYLDITKLEVLKTNLTLTLAETPYFNDSDVSWRFYNIWIDTSMEDTYPNTTVFDTEQYEYVAHFDCKWNGTHWLNNSYINAFRYYLTEDNSDKVMGQYWWDGDSWEDTDPNLDVAIINSNLITFDVDGAIHREGLLGTGAVVQGVANTSNGTTVDVAPDNGWVDEFDNTCEPPSDNETNGIPFSNIGFILGFLCLGVIGSSIKILRKQN